MKILFVFTGGTIGSTLKKGNVISTDPKKSYKIIRAYSEKYDVDFDYDITEPYTELSENNTGEHIRMLAQCVKNNLDAGYDGIIVTHGTDTLQYSAAALGYMVGTESVPICLVSANRPIEHEKSNALANLHGAISFIKNGEGRGVFVPYQNDNSDTVRVHRGTRLIGTKAFSDDVSSILGSVYGCFDEDFKFVKNGNYRENADEMPLADISVLNERSEGILVLFPYPGMVYPKLDESVRYILLNTYHSGTLDTCSTRAREFFREASERGIEVFATGITGGPEYESVGAFGELGIIPIKNISPVAAYVKLWILSENGKEAAEMLGLSLGGDIAP